MLFQFLKLFGLDVPAKIDAATANLEVGLERVTEHLKQVAQDAAVIAALSASAVIAGAMAVGVGLIALYRWTAEAAGAYAGLGVEGVVLVAMTIVLAAAAIIKRKSLSRTRIELPRCAAGAAGATSDSAAALNASAVDARATAPDSTTLSTGKPPPTPTASASDLVEPLAFLLTKLPERQGFGDPIVAEPIGDLRAPARGAASDAIDRAANVIRNGARIDIAVVLAGAAFIGWLLTRPSRRP